MSCAGRLSRGSTSIPSSWWRRASSSSSWCLASASSSSRARRWASAARWHGAGSGSELLDAGATQTLHSRVGSCPLSRRRPRGDASRAEVVDVGRHQVVREGGLSMGYIVVYRSMNSPQASGSTLLAWKARSVR
jgi:hypothetical protein